MICLLLLHVLLHLANASPTQQKTPVIPVHGIAQFPNETWVENIATLSDGDLLVTIFLYAPELYRINPANPTPKLVATFPEALGLLGITEIATDVYAVAKGNLTFAGVQNPNSFAIWKADFSGGRKTPALSPIANLPDVTILNGLTTPSDTNFILAADSLGGAIWRLNVRTGEYHVLINDTSTRPIGTLDQGGFGADGIRYHQGYLYYTNTNLGFYRVPVSDDGTLTGSVQLLSNFSAGDDFAFDKCGNVFISRGGKDEIDVYTKAGQLLPVSFASTDKKTDAGVLLAGNTAMMFGKSRDTSTTLYITTNGGIEGAPPGTPVQGGRVLAADLHCNPFCS